MPTERFPALKDIKDSTFYRPTSKTFGCTIEQLKKQTIRRKTDSITRKPGDSARVAQIVSSCPGGSFDRMRLQQILCGWCERRQLSTFSLASTLLGKSLSCTQHRNAFSRG
ncbi:hypothetical protein PF005_g21846 [Phytophthora fragariae]|uniref:Uncharacterized protein n=1 Tax=Phytophthora fragariae TaxID=53985 RepID=A0A6A3HWC9_9STRA|nr:hypothetical protein PF009_g26631 [Phytophthora fragariae]KAE8974889.1 hypothetical protein PF011_g24688 [Phytophthora fragariae]KAE9067219.1 hypothetical protein PF010_g27552 [Phytophthora fragariae]KAE9076666.1 hypothetical protein PF007_g24543 [Phytophthora fragariae]KAE9089685.1 hypothetical protein PF006_g25306 [Phytophthora fragariae]